MGPPQLDDARSIGLGGVLPPMCMWWTVWLAALWFFSSFIIVTLHSGFLLKSHQLLLLMKNSLCRLFMSSQSTSFRVQSPSAKLTVVAATAV